MYRDAQGTFYVHEESTASFAEEKKAPVWPWVVAGAAIVAGAALWMSQGPTKSPNPVDPDLDPLVLKAQDPETPWQRLKAFAEHEDREMRRALLQNPALCPVDDHGMVNTYLLYHLVEEFSDEAAEAPAFVLHAFYGDPKPMIRVIRRMVDYMKDPERVRSMFSLFGHLDEGIRLSAADNQVTPPEILHDLAEEWPRTVAYNRNTPPDVLRELMNHHLQWVRDGAKKNLSSRGLL